MEKQGKTTKFPHFFIHPSPWHQWEAESEKTAREVEKHFIDKGMKGGTGGGDHPNWVYIF